MEQILETIKSKSLRQSTRVKYHEIWTKFNRFVIALDYRPRKWEDRTPMFCAYMVDSGYQSTTVKSYISAIKKFLIEDGYDWNDKIVLFNAITCSCKLLNDCVRTRLPIQIGLLELILFEVPRVFHGTQPYIVTLYRAVFALAYYGLMRISELVYNNPNGQHFVRAKDIHVGMNKDKILVVLYSSKTHGKESRPQKIKIEAQEGDFGKNFCPFKLVRQFMQMRGGFDTKDDPFFIFSSGDKVTATHVRKVLKSCLCRLNLDFTLYDFHSYRIGMASDVMKNHFSLEEIKQKGRWKSNAVYKYLKNI